MKRWGPLANLVVPLLLAACQAATGSNGATPHATVPVDPASPSSTASATPSDRPGLYTTRCSAGQLAVSWGDRVSEPTGQHSVALIITNISANGCYLFGYPQVAFVDGAGHPIPFQYQSSGDQVVTSAPPGHVDVASQGLAYVMVNKYRCDAAELLQASGLRFTPPGDTVSLDVAIAGMDYCGPTGPGSVVHVSPVEPSFTASLAS